jgi:hypothetical protein
MHSHTKTIDRRTNSLHELSSGGIAFVGDAAYTVSDKVISVIVITSTIRNELMFYLYKSS